MTIAIRALAFVLVLCAAAGARAGDYADRALPGLSPDAATFASHASRTTDVTDRRR
jgi:hypothetical protein